MGEIERHLDDLIDAKKRLEGRDLVFLLALPGGFGNTFSERIRGASIQVIEDATWDALAHAEMALAASGTVTIEAALLGCPLVTFYKVNALSWILGRWLVRVPFLSMVNLVAGRKIAPELIQGEMTGEKIAAEAIRLLDDEAAMDAMRAGLEGSCGEARERAGSDGDGGGVGREGCDMKKLVVISLLDGDRGGERAGQVRDRGARQQKIDVQSYLIDAQVDPRAQTLSATVHGALHSSRRHVAGDVRAEQRLEYFEGDGRGRAAGAIVAIAAGHERAAEPAADAEEGQGRGAHVCVRREAVGRRGIAGIRDQVRGDSSGGVVSAVSGALVSGERLFDGPVQLRSEGHGAGRIQSGRERNGRAKTGRCVPVQV